MEYIIVPMPESAVAPSIMDLRVSLSILLNVTFKLSMNDIIMSERFLVSSGLNPDILNVRRPCVNGTNASPRDFSTLAPMNPSAVLPTDLIASFTKPKNPLEALAGAIAPILAPMVPVIAPASDVVSSKVQPMALNLDKPYEKTTMATLRPRSIAIPNPTVTRLAIPPTNPPSAFPIFPNMPSPFLTSPPPMDPSNPRMGAAMAPANDTESSSFQLSPLNILSENEYISMAAENMSSTTLNVARTAAPASANSATAPNPTAAKPSPPITALAFSMSSHPIALNINMDTPIMASDAANNNIDLVPACVSMPSILPTANAMVDITSNPITAPALAISSHATTLNISMDIPIIIVAAAMTSSVLPTVFGVSPIIFMRAKPAPTTRSSPMVAAALR